MPKPIRKPARTGPWRPPPLAKVWGKPIGCVIRFDGSECACKQNHRRLYTAKLDLAIFGHAAFKESDFIYAAEHGWLVTTFIGHDGCFDYEVVKRFCTGDREWLYLACREHKQVRCVHLDDCWPQRKG